VAGSPLSGQPSSLQRNRHEEEAESQPKQKQKQKTRGSNSREQFTGYATIPPETADVPKPDASKWVARARVADLIPAISAELGTGAVVHVVRNIAFLELDRGSGDTDGHDGEECCEEISEE
jgi:hypothetical protein